MSAAGDPPPGVVEPEPRRPAHRQPADAAPPVVIGIGRSPRSWDALLWATAEAAAGQRPLRIVHAFGWPPPGSAFDASLGATLADSEEVAAALLADAVHRAGTIEPALEISTVLRRAPTAAVLLEQAREADLVVIGTAGHGALRKLLPGSLDDRVVGGASCPVTVVRPFAVVSPGPSVTRVVVGVDGTPASALAVGFAFRAAARRGVGLTAVRGCLVSKLERSLAVWRDIFPDVDVRTTFAVQPLGAALVTESAGAALTVVASRWRRGLRRRRTSASHVVLRHAHSPVAVIKARP